MSFNVFEEKLWVSKYKKIWDEFESRLFEKLATEPIKGRYVRGKLKTRKEIIKTNFYGCIVAYVMYCNAAAVLKIDSVNKQCKNYHPQVYVEECKYMNVEKQRRIMLSDNDDDDDDDDDDKDDGFLEVKNIFVTCLGSQKTKNK